MPSKTQASRFINEGNDSNTTNDIKAAIDSTVESKDARLLLSKFKNVIISDKPPKITSITVNTQLIILECGKAYGVGDKKCVAWTDLVKDGLSIPFELKTLEDAQIIRDTCT